MWRNVIIDGHFAAFRARNLAHHRAKVRPSSELLHAVFGDVKQVIAGQSLAIRAGDDHGKFQFARRRGHNLGDLGTKFVGAGIANELCTDYLRPHCSILTRFLRV
jgi:hypothetical protein